MQMFMQVYLKNFYENWLIEKKDRAYWIDFKIESVKTTFIWNENTEVLCRQ